MSRNRARWSGKTGFTIIEVVIAMAILATVMASVTGGLYALNLAHRANREQAVAREIVQVLSERIVGASWGTIGRKLQVPGSNGWCWHRRATPAPANATPFYGPLIEKPIPGDPNHSPDPGETTTDSRDLLALGIIGSPSGIESLRVYIEYYNDTVVLNAGQRMAAAGASVQLVKAWQQEMGEPRIRLPNPPVLPQSFSGAVTIMPENHDVMDLNTLERVVIVRILVAWVSCYDRPVRDPLANNEVIPTRWHEVILARRK